MFRAESLAKNVTKNSQRGRAGLENRQRLHVKVQLLKKVLVLVSVS